MLACARATIGSATSDAANAARPSATRIARAPVIDGLQIRALDASARQFAGDESPHAIVKIGHTEPLGVRPTCIARNRVFHHFETTHRVGDGGRALLVEKDASRLVVGTGAR